MISAFDWERLGVILSVVGVAISSAIIVTIVIGYFMVYVVRRQLSTSATKSYNFRTLEHYFIPLKLMLLKLTQLPVKEIDALVKEQLSTGYVKLRINTSAIFINKVVLPIEPSKNDPAAILAIDNVFKELHNTKGKLGYWLQLSDTNKQYVEQTPLDFFQHISGICQDIISSHKHFHLGLDKYGLNVSKVSPQGTICSRHTLKIVELYPELNKLNNKSAGENIPSGIRNWKPA